MKVVTVKLRTTNETEKALADTMERFNKACNHLSGIAWDTRTFRAFDLHHAGYHATRERFGLPSEMAPPFARAQLTQENRLRRFL